MFHYIAWCLAGCLFMVEAQAEVQPVSGPDFNREVRPILARSCFKCHGPDEQARRAKLRLDTPETALHATSSGRIPIVPGKPEQSEVVARIFNPDPEEAMPPASKKLALSDQQKQILKQWIAAGAHYAPHWAFIKPQQAPLPRVIHPVWPKNAIDRFILARLENEGLTPSPPANPYVLVRRLYLDLIGLPPTPQEADDFVHDQSEAAYEKLVDHLLASPQYGERWARKWLDLARYADTNGYEKDRQRSIWPWRDWVIKALNDDMPFNQFTIEQIAGDMLSHPTQDQLVATGFHRNTMLNEEGGIDPLEFRFYSMVDRMATTGKTWLGMTIQCAQCHTHKYDPIPHREYYQMMAFLDNADEPEYEVKTPDNEKHRADIQAKIAALELDLTNRFPVEDSFWMTPTNQEVTATSGQKPELLPDGSWLFAQASSPTDTYVIQIEAPATNIAFLRLEVIPNDKLPKKGPGRSESGNFVLSHFSVGILGTNQAPQPLKIVKATADFSQEHFDVAGALGENPQSGWAIANPDGKSGMPHAATFVLEEQQTFAENTRLEIRLDQQYGTGHTIGRFRLSFGVPINDPRPFSVRRQEIIQNKYASWLSHESSHAVSWTQLRPLEAKANLPFLTVLEDNSILASGDQTKSDTYRLKYHTDLRNITAIRLEAMPDERLPRHGPGRTYFEGPAGDFNLSDFRLFAGGTKMRFQTASHSFAAPGFPATNAIDTNMQTGWAIDGGQGHAHTAVFNLSDPLSNAGEFEIEMLFERHFCSDLGRFRISVTTDPRQVTASDLPSEIENIFLISESERTAAQRERLFQQYLASAPELSDARAEIQHLRQQLEEFPTTLVMKERPAENPRPTFIHKRGDFLQPTERVEPAILSVLNASTTTPPRNRLEFARWLVCPDHPLTARVTVNRQWAAFFGRGIVRTVDDFGYQGDPPSHPELLDWLAVEFVKERWSLKKLHKLIVMSATYRQSSAISAELLAKDPANILLARGPRVRLESEMIRDSLLRVSGLLSTRIGGPSVFPPQPASVTTDGAYGPLTWKISEGPDRYRRGLYTFSKRTAPYAMFNTFDGPTGETCIAQREVSDTPLQALTLLNDTVIVEAAQALGRTFAAREGAIETRVAELFRRCLIRPPEPEEMPLLLQFYQEQEKRFAANPSEAEAMAGKSEGPAAARAAWTALARALFNLDEAITKS